MPITSPVHEERIAALEASLAADGVDALVVYAMGSTLGPGTRTHGSMRFLCDWDSHHNPSILVLRPGIAPTLLVVNVFSSFFARDHSWLPDVRLVPAADLPATAARLCAERSGSPSRLAIVGRNEMPVPIWEAVSRALPGAEWVDVTDRLDRLRVVKSDAELAGHERAATVCDAMFETLGREIRTRRPAFQLQAEMERTARYAGCDYCMTWLTIGPEADYSRTFRDECRRVPEPGDQVLAGIYLILDGFWGHAIRTGSFGTPTAPHRRAYAIAREMEDAMAETLGPDRDLNDVQAAATAILRGRLSAAEFGRLFHFRDAHGLGYCYEDPIVTAPFPQPYGPVPPTVPLAARPGMLFELHPNLFVPGLGGASIGDMVAVTETGRRMLTAFPRELIDWSA